MQLPAQPAGATIDCWVKSVRTRLLSRCSIEQATQDFLTTSVVKPGEKIQITRRFKRSNNILLEALRAYHIHIWRPGLTAAVARKLSTYVRLIENVQVTIFTEFYFIGPRSVVHCRSCCPPPIWPSTTLRQSPMHSQCHRALPSGWMCSLKSTVPRLLEKEGNRGCRRTKQGELIKKVIGIESAGNRASIRFWSNLVNQETHNHFRSSANFLVTPSHSSPTAAGSPVVPRSTYVPVP